MITLIFQSGKETVTVCDQESVDLHDTLCKARHHKDVSDHKLVRILRD